MKSRRLTYDDYETLVEWWSKWPDWVPLSRSLLPENGTGGIMIEKDNKPLVAGFLYGTNSKVAWMEWIVSDPSIKTDKSEAILLLISSLENWAIEGGFELILSVGKSKSLIDKHKKLGYTVDHTPSYEIIKKI